MKGELHQLEFDGAILVRGFRLYIWEIFVADGPTLHYVGKTGDKSSGASQSPFDRLSKHLGNNENKDRAYEGPSQGTQADLRHEALQSVLEIRAGSGLVPRAVSKATVAATSGA